MKRKGMTLIFTLLTALLLTVPSFAVSGDYVMDTAELLDVQEQAELEELAKVVGDRYDCGVYIVTVDDHRAYSGDVFDAAVDWYHGNGLGLGTGRDGALLYMSMRTRDYAIFFYGENSEYAFNSYGQMMLEEEFLDDFGYDDWYGGFFDYVTTCGAYLEKAAAGDPVRESIAPYLAGSAAIALIVAWAVCNVLKRMMRSVGIQSRADVYTAEGGLDLTGRTDLYSHTTRVVTRIKRESSSSSARSGGGGSGRSGKF